MIDGNALFRIVAQMGGMKFFPADEHARVGIAKRIAAMCNDIDQAHWLSERMMDLFPEGWPGIGEMRAVYCSKYRPRDGVEADSKAFPLGIPSEVPGRDDEIAGFLPVTAKPLLLAGGVASAAPSIQGAIEILREAKALKRIADPPPRAPVIPAVQVTDKNRITAADIEKAVDELRRGREAKGTE